MKRLFSIGAFLLALLLAVGCSKNDDDFIGEELETPTKLAIQITETDAVLRFSDNETKTIHYTIVGDGANLVVKAEMQNDDEGYTLRTTPTSKTTGTVEIRAKNPTDNRVIVSVSDGRQTIQTSIAVSPYPSFDGQTIWVETPGTLKQLLAEHNQSTISELTVNGSINEEDIAILAALPNLSVLDIENTDLKKLPSAAFKDNQTLTSIKLPQVLTTIGNAAFQGCVGLTGNLTIPEGVTTIGSYAFKGCSGLTGNLTIPAGVTTIEWEVFSGCSGLTGTLTIPNSVTRICTWAFMDCSGLTGTLSIPNSVATIDQGAFHNCSSLTGDLTIPESVTTIGVGAFAYCSSLTGDLTIPNSVTTIELGTFSDCSGLTSMTIPESIIRIEKNAFYGSSNLVQINCKSNTPPLIDNDIFKQTLTQNCVLYVPTGCAEAYRTAEGWKDYTFKDIIETEF